MDPRRLTAIALLIATAFALPACTTADEAIDTTPDSAAANPGPTASTTPAPARPAFVTCPDGGPSRVVLDFEPSRDSTDTLDKVLAGYLKFQRKQQPTLAAWYADSNFREVPYDATEDNPDGQRANPDRTRSYLGARPDGTGFHLASFTRTYVDGGWNFVGAQMCNGESSEPSR